MPVHDFVEQLRRQVTLCSTAQLVAVRKDTCLPQVWGSGFLFAADFGIYLVTALHNALLRTTTIQGKPTVQGSIWKMENRWVRGFKLIRDLSIPDDYTTGLPIFDFSLANIPPDGNYARWSFSIQNGISSVPLRRLSIADIRSSDQFCNDEVFSFCATVSPRDSEGNIFCGAQIVLTDFLYIHDLKYHHKDNYHIWFKTSRSISDYEIDFAGSSGAPVLDSVGRVVAMICGGEEDDDCLVRCIRLDVMFNAMRNKILTIDQLEDKRNDPDIACRLMTFLDADQKKFYWDEVDKGNIV